MTIFFLAVRRLVLLFPLVSLHVLEQISAFQLLQPHHPVVPSVKRSSLSRLFASTLERGADATHETSHTDNSLKESEVLRSMLGAVSVREFLETTWQIKPQVFSPQVPGDPQQPLSNNPEKQWDPTQADNSKTLLETSIQQGWHVLADLIEQAPLSSKNNSDLELPVVIHQGNPQRLDTILNIYGSLWGAYLDGCSLVQIHADLISPWIAAIAKDLQHTFPYVFAQTYLTPPFSQTLDPHADDRDVFVIQLVGSKEWQVHERVPIPFPYSHEQVGKNMQVPQNVLDGPKSVSQTLYPGDILYIPRGHVHQASCSDSLSFHITIAVATFDWTMAGMIHAATQQILTQHAECRKSILPAPDNLHEHLEHALDILKKEVTVDLVMANLQSRIDRHRQRDDPLRAQVIQTMPSTTAFLTEETPTVGSAAAPLVTWDSHVRAATHEESLLANPENNTRTKFLRTETNEELLSMVARLQGDPTLQCQVSDLRTLTDNNDERNPYVCDLTLLAWAKEAVARGELALVVKNA